MNTTIFEKFNEARDSFKNAQKMYEEQKDVIRDELTKLLPTRSQGSVTAIELSEQTGINSNTIANLLSHLRSSDKKLVSTTYVCLREDGTINYDKKIVKERMVCTYYV